MEMILEKNTPENFPEFDIDVTPKQFIV